MTRPERAEAALRLRAAGNTVRAIAAALGVSKTYAHTLCTDPTGQKDRARKERYGRLCVQCGRRTNGSNGRRGAAEVCGPCSHARPRPRVAV